MCRASGPRPPTRPVRPEPSAAARVAQPPDTQPQTVCSCWAFNFRSTRASASASAPSSAPPRYHRQPRNQRWRPSTRQVASSRAHRHGPIAARQKETEQSSHEQAGAGEQARDPEAGGWRSVRPPASGNLAWRRVPSHFICGDPPEDRISHHGSGSTDKRSRTAQEARSDGRHGN